VLASVAVASRWWKSTAPQGANTIANVAPTPSPSPQPSPTPSPSALPKREPSPNNQQPKPLKKESKTKSLVRKLKNIFNKATRSESQCCRNLIFFVSPAFLCEKGWGRRYGSYRVKPLPTSPKGKGTKPQIRTHNRNR